MVHVPYRGAAALTLTTYGYPGDLASLFIHHGDRKSLPAIILRKLRGEHGPVRYGILSRGESRSRVVRRRERLAPPDQVAPVRAAPSVP